MSLVNGNLDGLCSFAVQGPLRGGGTSVTGPVSKV